MLRGRTFVRGEGENAPRRYLRQRCPSQIGHLGILRGQIGEDSDQVFLAEREKTAGHVEDDVARKES